ncbi:MAG: hypothetical protein M0P61_00480 [Ignavibacteriaceae bacterium]|jgi:hypothetical protein|nr:hypothetical protein [Ignavibacteriaceae bacterium]
MNTKEYTDLTFVGTDSPAIYLAKHILTALVIPVDTDYDGKSLTVKAGNSTTDLKQVYDQDGDAVVIQIGSNRYIFLDLQNFAGATYLQFVASASLDGKTIKAVTFNTQE